MSFQEATLKDGRLIVQKQRNIYKTDDVNKKKRAVGYMKKQ